MSSVEATPEQPRAPSPTEPPPADQEAAMVAVLEDAILNAIMMSFVFKKTRETARQINE